MIVLVEPVVHANDAVGFELVRVGGLPIFRHRLRHRLDRISNQVFDNAHHEKIIKEVLGSVVSEVVLDKRARLTGLRLHEFRGLAHDSGKVLALLLGFQRATGREVVHQASVAVHAVGIRLEHILKRALKQLQVKPGIAGNPSLFQSLLEPREVAAELRQERHQHSGLVGQVVRGAPHPFQGRHLAAALHQATVAHRQRANITDDIEHLEVGFVKVALDFIDNLDDTEGLRARNHQRHRQHRTHRHARLALEVGAGLHARVREFVDPRGASLENLARHPEVVRNI